MNPRMFISIDSEHSSPLAVADKVTRVAASFKLCANVTPMYSSGYNRQIGDYGVELACRLDILGHIDKDTILVLWENLRHVLGIHCVWLDYADASTLPDDDYSYSGCICEWPYYVAHHDHIDHAHALSCSEYSGKPVVVSLDVNAAGIPCVPKAPPAD